MKRLILMSAVLSVLYGSGAAWADDPPAAPATQSQGQSLKATITGVEGIVQVRSGEDDPWKAAKVGMVIG
ncbi:MAG: hypothetical protein ABSH20_18130, partial [Tepidisphaeraceae bacterium]